MALIISNGTGGGLASIGSSWLGGVVPVLGDSVQIAITDTIEIDGTYNWGDGTASAMVVNGTIQMSAVVTSGLLLNGDAVFSSGSWLRATILQTLDVNVVSINATSSTIIAREVWNTNLPLGLVSLFPSLTLYPSITLYPQG